MMKHLARSSCALIASVLILLSASCTTTPMKSATNTKIFGSDSIVGVMDGKGGTDGSAGTYIIKIDLPPGRDNVMPILKISYSSQAGNSILGMGWSINGFNEIFRCPATIAMDGYSSGVRYAATDRLCLNGDHLMLIKGVYGKSDSEYRTELESFNLVHLYGDIDKPGSYFEIIYRNGSKLFCRQIQTDLGKSTPLSWLETLFEDTDGDTIERRYDTTHPGELLLSEIFYTGRDSDGKLIPGTRMIRFVYEQRPDVTSSFLAGGETLQTQRLKSIVISMPTDFKDARAKEIREYDLGYLTSQSTGRSLLTTVQECAFDSDDKRLCLPAADFTWTDEKLSFKKPVAYTLPILDAQLTPGQLIDATKVLQSPYYVTGDFDGDGRRELLYYRHGVGAHLYFINPDGSMRKDADVSAFFQPSADVPDHNFTGDVDNDGADDLPGNVNGHLAFMSWNGHDLGKPVITDIPYSEDMALVDLDGDGHVDVLQTELEKPGSSNRAIYFYRNLNSRPGQLHFAPRQKIYALRDYTYNGHAEKAHFDIIGDLDGNGLSDIAIVSTMQIEQIIFTFQTPDGHMRFEIKTPTAIGMVNRTFRQNTYFADINGDGLLDIVYTDTVGNKPGTWHYQINTGDHFKPPVDTRVVDERPVGIGITSTLVSDVANDGKDELIYPEHLIVPYCIGSTRQAAHDYTIYDYTCSQELDVGDPFDDLGIYQFAVLKFIELPDGSLKPEVNHDSGIIAQANLLTEGDLQGDGLTDIISPFSPWFANGRFKIGNNQYSMCPPVYGCGLHVASNISAGHEYGVNGAPDLMLSINNGIGGRTLWDYYPMSSNKPGFYSVKQVGTQERYLDNESYYFTSSMYMVGGYAESSGVGNGYYAYTEQYADSVYDTNGRRYAGYRTQVENNISAGTRMVWVYAQKFPFTGNILTEWKETADSKGDDMKAGIPDPGHGYYLTETWDCQGPTGSVDLEGHPCVPSDVPTYSTRLRHKTEYFYDNKKSIWVNTDAASDYDLYGNVLHSIVKTHTDMQDTTVETYSSFMPPELNLWLINRLQEEKTITTTVPIGQDKTPGKQTTSTKMVEYVINAQHFLTKQVTHDDGPYVETRNLTFQEDPTATDYGQLIRITITTNDVKDGSEESLRTIHFNYSPNGYFLTSANSASGGEDIFETDPISGNYTKSVKDGVTTLDKYDLLGRVIFEQSTEDKKPTTTYINEYLPCDDKCPKNAVYYALVKKDGTDYGYIWYNVRNEKM